MLHKVIPSAGLPSVDAYSDAIDRWLAKADNVKQQRGVEPALTAADFLDEIEEISRIRHKSGVSTQQAQYAAIETALRDKFYELLASTSINLPSFSTTWNLLDIVVIISDKEYCEPTLVIWLVEELLDSQTIQDCRKVFDYLESRRERIITKHFKSKSLAILRACNELLRRLSRAEDTVFCGRVFIFLFQSFPLGDRSSVNLRGEYHVDNITTYDNIPGEISGTPKCMDLDGDGDGDKQPNIADPNQFDPSTMDLTQSGDGSQAMKDTKVVKFKKSANHETGDEQSAVIDTGKLYPIFWSLQQYFSTPTTIFDSANLEAFKGGLEATVGKFKEVQRDFETRGGSKTAEEGRHGIKRKRGDAGEEMSSSFNPRYLTSRDLFELEISDMAFRRHVLVQALILLDFLLSLTPKAKSKVENMKNKSVLYDYTLEEEDANWATQMRSEIANYLAQGTEGKFYYRMVDTVLLRDKNWVRWKAENCPPYQRASISPNDVVEARNAAHKTSITKRLRAMPLGSLDLHFLSDGETADGLDKLKEPARFSIPAAESFRGPIADEDFEVQMAKSEEEKQLALNGRASKLWRLLRIVHRSKFNLFDRLDDGNNIQVLFDDAEAEQESRQGEDETGDQDQSGLKLLGRPAVTVSEAATVEETVVK